MPSGEIVGSIGPWNSNVAPGGLSETGVAKSAVTPERLAQYVKSFSPTFTGITAGDQAAVEEFALKLGVPVAISEQPGGNYTVDHSAAIFVVDPNGALRALSSTPHNVPVIAEDYRSIVAASPLS